MTGALWRLSRIPAVHRHLGHLHHTLSPEHLKKLGRIDVLLVPVDGGYTLETFDMMEVLRSINA